MCVLLPVVLSHLESGWHSCQCVEVFWPLVPQLLHHWKHVQHHTLPSLHTVIKPEEKIHVSHVILPYINYYIDNTNVTKLVLVSQTVCNTYCTQCINERPLRDR